MLKNDLLCLRDYRIIKILISGNNPLDYVSFLQMSENEIRARLNKLRNMLPQLYKLDSVKCKEM